MLLSAAITWGMRTIRPEVIAYDPDFDAVPLQLAGFTGEVVPRDEAIAEYLEADEMRSLAYRRDDVIVDASLIHGLSWRTVHTPAACLPSQGWNVEWERAVTVPLEAAAPHEGPVRGQLMRVNRGDYSMMVLFVFAHKGGTNPDYAEHSLAVMSGPRGAGGLSIMLTTAITQRGPFPARQDLLDLMGGIYPYAVDFWYRDDA